MRFLRMFLRRVRDCLQEGEVVTCRECSQPIIPSLDGGWDFDKPTRRHDCIIAAVRSPEEARCVR